METFAKNLKIAREAAGFTQDSLAKKLGISYYTYKHYESVISGFHREPDQEMLVLIAKTLNVTIDSLLITDN